MHFSISSAKQQTSSFLVASACTMLFTLAAPSAQSQSSVAFNTDGSVEVTNDTLVLQTTALLNLRELYQLKKDADAVGILMTRDSRFGPGARVEVRVFDFDEVRAEKGALIYAAKGTRTGWNEDEWSATTSLFGDSAGFSPTVTNLFDGQYIKTNNIKVLSQSESLNTVCRPGVGAGATGRRYVDGAMNNLMASVVPFDKPLNHRRDDDDEEEPESCDNLSKLQDARQKVQEAKQRLEKKIADTQVALDKAREAKKNAEFARQVLREAKYKSAQAQVSFHTKNTRAKAAREEALKAEQKVKAAETVKSLATAWKQEAEKSVSTCQKNVAYQHGQLMEANADRLIAEANAQIAKAAFDQAQRELQAAQVALMTATSRYIASGSITDLQAVSLEEDVVASAMDKVRVTKNQLDAANSLVRKANLRAKDASAKHLRAQSKLLAAQAARTQAYQAEKNAEAEYANTLSTSQAALAAATQAQNEAIAASEEAEAATRAVDTAQAGAAQADAIADERQAQAETLQQEAEAAARALSQAEAALAKAGAEVADTFKQTDDDDDNAAAGLVAVEQYMNDPDLAPISLVTSLMAFGYSYLFDDVQDAELFHDKAITAEGLEIFDAILRQCTLAEHSWCETISPMPVVLVEVAIHDAQLNKIKIPGLPFLVPNHMLSSGKLYSNKTDVNYVDLRVTSPSLAAGYKIVNADFTNDVHPANFSKYDHLVVPPLNVKVVEEFTTDNWGRLPMVGTPSRLQEITRQLTQVAEDAGMPADQAFSFNHISHRFMTVKNETVNGRPKDYELWNLVLNKDFLTGFSTEVTLEGPFLPCNGPEPGTQVKLPFHNHEMILRMETSDSLKTEKAVSEITELPLLIYPNPARDSFHVRFNLSASSPVKLIVFNSLGVNLYEEETDLAPGWHTTSVDLSNVSHSGVCFVSVTTAQGARMGKVLVE